MSWWEVAAILASVAAAAYPVARAVASWRHVRRCGVCRLARRIQRLHRP